MRISDWSSDVCSSDLDRGFADAQFGGQLGLGDAALAAQPLQPRAEALFARRRFGGLGQLATDRAAKLRRAERRRSDRATETAAIEPPARPDHLDRGGPGVRQADLDAIADAE